MFQPPTDIVRTFIRSPGTLPSRSWDEISAVFPPDKLMKISRWSRVLISRAEFMGITQDSHRFYAGRIARTNVVGKPDATASKAQGRVRVKFGVFKNAVNQFALDLYKQPGFGHEAALVRYFFETVDERTLVVDVGAHFGYFCCLVADLGGTAIAVEMQRTLCLNIEANISLNDFWRIHVICAALGPEPGIVQVERMNPSPGKQVSERGFKLGVAPLHSQNHEIVPVVTIDSLVAERMREEFEKVIVKIDIEGAEALALRGAAKTIARRSAVFIVEIHVGQIAKFSGSVQGILDQFPDRNWRAILMDEGGETHVAVPGLLAAAQAWRPGDENLCVRFEPR